MKSLAQFMTAGPARQRTILRNNKFPKDAMVIIAYYNYATNAIRDFHESGNDPAVLVKVIDDLRKKAVGKKAQAVSKIENNIRAIESYLKHFGNSKTKLLSVPKMKYARGNVSISIVPDLLIESDGQKQIVKLDCTLDAATDAQQDIMLQLMHEAAIENKLGVTSKNILYIDAASTEPRRASKIKKNLKKEIDAACDNIEGMWEGIKKG